jgi:hypothetical protein
MIDDNLAFVRSMEEDLFNHRDLTAVDRYVSPAYTLRTAEEGAPSGREAIKAYIAAYLAGFSDLHISIDQLLAVGDKVVGVFTWRPSLVLPREPLPRGLPARPDSLPDARPWHTVFSQ